MAKHQIWSRWPSRNNCLADRLGIGYNLLAYVDAAAEQQLFYTKEVDPNVNTMAMVAAREHLNIAIFDGLETSVSESHIRLYFEVAL